MLHSWRVRRLALAGLGTIAFGMAEFSAGMPFGVSTASAQQSKSDADCEKVKKRIDELVNRRAIWERRLANAKLELSNEQAVYTTASTEYRAAQKEYYAAEGQYYNSTKKTNFSSTAQGGPMLKKLQDAGDEESKANAGVQRATRNISRIQRELDAVNTELNGLLNTPCPPPQTAIPLPPAFPLITPLPGWLGVIAGIEPKISIGGGNASSRPTYDSTGGQAPFIGDFSQGYAQFCGGATFWPGFVVGPGRVGLDVNACSGSNAFGHGDDTLFGIQRHGSGDVVLRSSTSATIDALIKFEVPLSTRSDTSSLPNLPFINRFYGESTTVSVGVGLTSRNLNLNLTSDQRFFGGGLPSIGESTWQTGFGLSAGVSTFVCPNCVGGNPLKAGLEGRARFFPSQSISLRSPAFGFTETGSTGRTTDYSVLMTFGMPIGVR